LGIFQKILAKLGLGAPLRVPHEGGKGVVCQASLQPAPVHEVEARQNAQQVQPRWPITTALNPDDTPGKEN